MEGNNSRPSESDTYQTEKLDNDDDSKITKKKKKAATAVHNRIDDSAEEKAASRLKAKQELAGSISLFKTIDTQKKEKESKPAEHADIPQSSEESTDKQPEQENATGRAEVPVDLTEDDTVHVESNSGGEVESAEYEHDGVEVELDGIDDIDDIDRPNEELAEYTEIIDDPSPDESVAADHSTPDEAVSISQSATSVPAVRPTGSGASVVFSAINSPSPSAHAGTAQPVRSAPTAPQYNPPTNPHHRPPVGTSPQPTPQRAPIPQYNSVQSAPPNVGAYNTQPAATTSPNTAPRLEQRVIEKHNHFIAGLIVGGLYEHFKHKKNEKKLTKELKNDQTKFRELSAMDAQNQLEITTLKNKQTKDKTNKKWQEHFEPVLAPVMLEKNIVPDVAESNRQKLHTSEVSMPLQLSNEKTSTTQENQAPRAERITALPDILSESTDRVERTPPLDAKDEQYIVPDDRRVESSSWHKIEIDKATGKPVENPTFTYGEAFQKERQQEVRQQDDDATLQQAAADNGVAAAALGGAQANAPDTSEAPKPANQPRSAASSPVQQAVIEQTQRIDTKKSNDPVSAVLWIVFVVVVAAILYVAL